MQYAGMGVGLGAICGYGVGLGTICGYGGGAQYIYKGLNFFTQQNMLIER